MFTYLNVHVLHCTGRGGADRRAYIHIYIYIYIYIYIDIDIDIDICRKGDLIVELGGAAVTDCRDAIDMIETRPPDLQLKYFTEAQWREMKGGGQWGRGGGKTGALCGA